MNVIINGVKQNIEEKTVTYEGICALAGEPLYSSCTYWVKGPGDSNRSGILSPGKSVDIQEGMRFNCMPTGNA